MNSPQEKAAELLMKYQNIEALKDFGGMDFEIAKQCAIIAVKELIENNRNLLDTISYHTELNYLQEVLAELNKL